MTRALDIFHFFNFFSDVLISDDIVVIAAPTDNDAREPEDILIEDLIPDTTTHSTTSQGNVNIYQLSIISILGWLMQRQNIL